MRTLRVLGEQIKARRQSLVLTLEELALRARVSRAMLSAIERGQKTPSIVIVSQIAESLGCTVSELLGEVLPEKYQPQIIRRQQQQALIDPISGVERHLLAPFFVQRGVEVVLYILPPHQSAGPFPPHQSGVIEHITILEGAMQGQVGAIGFLLACGDSITFRADHEHTLINSGEVPCRCLLIIDSQRKE